MPPTIRVDDQVYKWLQSQAIPFEDNPNSVLRRLAGLDMAAFRERSGTAQTGGIGSRARADGPMVDAPSTSSSPGLSRGSTWMAGSSPAMTEGSVRASARRRVDRAGRRSPLATGKDCIRRWKLQVRQARFHRDGSWYERLDRFPAAYCDPDGYKVFDSEDDLRTTPGVRIEPSGQVWVPGGIAKLRGYRKIDDPIQDPNGS